MGHKVNPTSFRLGITTSWNSRWYSPHRKYADLLRQDVEIRKFLKTRLKEAILERVEIERSPAHIAIIISAARPGIIIGRGGAGIEDLRKEIIAKFIKNAKQTVKISIQEVADANKSAAAILFYMIQDIEKRMPFRRVMKQSIEKVMKTGVLGVKIIISGRLNGAEIARTESLSQGKIPLHTLRANIDYARGKAQTTYGAIGLKVWIYKGDIFNKAVPSTNPAVTS